MDEDIAHANFLQNISVTGGNVGIQVEGGTIIADQLYFRGTRRPLVVKGGKGHRITNVHVD